jgi:anti-anti-sigma factor
MELSERKDNDVTVLEVVGRVDSVTAPDLGRSSRRSLAPRRAGCWSISPASSTSAAPGFRVLFLASKQAGETGGRLALCGLSAKALELFSIAGFLKLFTIAPSRAEGVAALR